MPLGLSFRVDPTLLRLGDINPSLLPVGVNPSLLCQTCSLARQWIWKSHHRDKKMLRWFHSVGPRRQPQARRCQGFTSKEHIYDNHSSAKKCLYFLSFGPNVGTSLLLVNCHALSADDQNDIRPWTDLVLDKELANMFRVAYRSTCFHIMISWYQSSWMMMRQVGSFEDRVKVRSHKFTLLAILTSPPNIYLPKEVSLSLNAIANLILPRSGWLGRPYVYVGGGPPAPGGTLMWCPRWSVRGVVSVVKL